MTTALMERPLIAEVSFDLGDGLVETLAGAFRNGVNDFGSLATNVEPKDAPTPIDYVEISNFAATEASLREASLQSPAETIEAKNRFLPQNFVKKIGAFLMLAGTFTGISMATTAKSAQAAETVLKCGEKAMEVKADGSLVKIGDSGTVKMVKCVNGTVPETKDKIFKSSCDRDLAYTKYYTGRINTNVTGCEVVEVGGSNPAAGDTTISPSQPGVDRTPDQITRDALPPGYVLRPDEPGIQFTDTEKAEAARAVAAAEAAKAQAVLDAITKQDAAFKCLRGRGVIDFPFIKYGDCDPEAGSWIMLIQTALNKCTELTSNHGDLYVPEILVVDGILGGATMRELVKRFPGYKGLLNESGQFVGVDQSLFVALTKGMNCDQQPDDLSGKPNILPSLNAAPKKGQITDSLDGAMRRKCSEGIADAKKNFTGFTYGALAYVYAQCLMTGVVTKTLMVGETVGRQIVPVSLNGKCGIVTAALNETAIFANNGKNICKKPNK